MSCDAEATLVERGIRGEEGAWREIYVSTRSRVFGLLCYQIGDRTEALDVLQETYMAAVSALPRFRGEGTLESWLCGIAIRKARDWRKRFFRRKNRVVSIEDHPADVGSRHLDPD